LAKIALSRSAFFHNLSLLAQKLGNKERIAVVLKDNAYGHGLIPMAELANAFGIIRAVVRTVEEAEAVAHLFDEILILNPRTPSSVDARFTLVVNDLDTLSTLPPHTRVDLKIDTGMHRNGLHAADLKKAFSLLIQQRLQLNGVMTHFRSADILGSELFWQTARWKSVKQEVLRLCGIHALPKPLFHSANSAAVLRLNHYDDDYARCGIATYGYHEMPKPFGPYDLKPVLKLYAQKITTLSLKKGERIGYGGTFAAPLDMRVSTYDIGYGDGLFRYDGEGECFLNGHKVLGKISMDSFSAEGDAEEICIIGDAKEIAHAFGTISYDLLVKLNPLIPRVVVP